MEGYKMPRHIVWFSCGAASAVAAKIAIKQHPDLILAYCETGAEHPDNERFLIDCEKWTSASVTRLKSEKYGSTWDVWESRKWLAGIDGAACTGELKVKPRQAFELSDDVHYFGYTCDGPDVKRANRLRLNYPDMEIRTPLIDAGLTKEACLAMIENAGIEIPALYKLGFHNNNCLPCVKATSPNYWANVRLCFPAEFGRMADLSRSLGVRLCRINDVRSFIDEIPDDWPTTEGLEPTCDFLCAIAEMGLADA